MLKIQEGNKNTRHRHCTTSINGSGVKRMPGGFVIWLVAVVSHEDEVGDTIEGARDCYQLLAKMGVTSPTTKQSL